MDEIRYEEFKETYVTRKCAEVDDIQTKLVEGARDFVASSHLSLVGPKYSGKSTTLMAAYLYCRDKKGMMCEFVDLKLNVEISTEARFYFIDNAQLLPQNLNIAGVLKKCARCICFSFSPTIRSVSGISTYNIGIPINGKSYQFGPFTEEELDTYRAIFPNTPNILLPLPGLLCKAKSSETETEDHLLSYIQHIFDHMSSKVASDKNICHIIDLVIGRCLGNHHSGRLVYVSEHQLCSCGLAYVDIYGKHQFLFSQACSSMILSVLYPVVISNYLLFTTYSKGGAEELLFSNVIMTIGIEVECFGRGYSITGRTETSQVVRLKGTELVVQDNLQQDISVPNQSTVVIKLRIDHPAIDFIVICRKSNNDSQRMYFVQVSIQAYQDWQSSARMTAVKMACPALDNLSPLEYYINKFRVKATYAFYVYASPSCPSGPANISNVDRLHFAQLSV